MKKLTRIFTMLMLAVIMALSFGAFTGCTGEKWDKTTYEVCVYLADGTTPVESIRVALCYNKPDNTSQCLSPKRTDANGKCVFDLKEIQFVGNPVIHFSNDNDIPSGYTFPTDFTYIEMVDGASYEKAIALTQKTTKIILAIAG